MMEAIHRLEGNKRSIHVQWIRIQRGFMNDIIEHWAPYHGCYIRDARSQAVTSHFDFLWSISGVHILIPIPSDKEARTYVLAISWCINL